MARDYPTHPDELTKEWLTGALRDAGLIERASVTGFSTTPVGEGIGMLGVIARVTPTYDVAEPKAPTSIVAKFPTPHPGNRAVAMAFRLYEREAGFYRHIAPFMGQAAPDCYASEVDGPSGDSVLLLEDLAGYRMGDQVAGCTAAEAYEIVDAVLPLHVKYWGQPETMPLDCVPHIDSESQIVGISAGCEAGWDPCVQLFGHVMAPEIKAARDRFVPSVPELHRMMGRRTQTVIHGDVRLDNLMFGTAPGHPPVRLVDWALTISTGLHDVAYLLSQNVTTEERRQHEKALLQHYYGRVCELGVTDYTFEEAWTDYRVAVLYLFCYAVVIGGTLDPANARGASFMEKLIQRSSDTVMDHDLLTLLPV